MPLPDEFLQELKLRTDIADVISSYVNLKRVGRNLVGLCPFHSEKTPSFSVSPENGFFHCFGCGVGGDVITFIKRIENLDYIDAVKLLASRAGLEMPTDTQSKGLSELRKRIFEANREAARFFHRALYSQDGVHALSYLRGRALSEATIKHFGLGYSPPSRFALVNYLRAKGFKDSELVSANLAFTTRSGHTMDRFFDRVMFPIIDVRGNVIAFGGRIMSDEKPKYLNTSDTPVFKKSSNLFALNFAKNVGENMLILCEGYMDVIALHQAGFQNAIATLGTSLTTEQAMIIKRYCDTVAICYDADEAGQKATSRAIGILRPTGIGIRIITVPSGKDPDEFIRSYGEQGPVRFRKLLESSGNDVRYQIQKVRKKYDTQIPEQRISFLNECARLLAELNSDIDADVYAGELAEELSVSKSSIKNEIEKYRKRSFRKESKERIRNIQLKTSAANDRINPEKHRNLRAANAEEAIIAILINNPDLADTIMSRISADSFVTSFNKRVFSVLLERVKEMRSVSPMDISEAFTADEMSSITSILSSRPRENNPKRAIREYIDILLEEKEKISPEKAASASDEEMLEYFKKLRERKK